MNGVPSIIIALVWVSCRPFDAHAVAFSPERSSDKCLSAGAIPVYYGDSAAAAFLFGKLNIPYIDVRYVWRRFARHCVNYEYPKSADWFMIAQYMHDFEKIFRV